MFKIRKRRKYILLFIICSLFFYLAPIRTLGSLTECDSITVFRNGMNVCELEDPTDYYTVDHDGEVVVGYGVYSLKDFRIADLLALRTAYTLRFYNHGNKIMTVRMLTISENSRLQAESKDRKTKQYIGDYRSEEQYIKDQYIICYYRRGMFFRFINNGLEGAIESAL